MSAQSIDHDAAEREALYLQLTREAQHLAVRYQNALTRIAGHQLAKGQTAPDLEESRELASQALSGKLPGGTPVLEAAARALVELANRQGLVLTIEQRPLQPLAIGHHETVVSVREARR